MHTIDISHKLAKVDFNGLRSKACSTSVWGKVLKVTLVLLQPGLTAVAQ